MSLLQDSVKKQDLILALPKADSNKFCSYFTTTNQTAIMFYFNLLFLFVQNCKGLKRCENIEFKIYTLSYNC